MNIQQLTQLVRLYFSEHAEPYNLRPDALPVEYRLNWGGFVNASFRIGGPARSYHFKITADPRNKARLKRWQRLHTTLENEYHAPRLVDWIDLPGSAYSGLLFDDIPGESPDLLNTPVLLQEVLSTVIRLHSDQVLAMVLRGLDGPRSCLKSYLLAYHTRFLEDLRVIEGYLPGWFSERQFDWLKQEVRALEKKARFSAAFQTPANSAVHGDLSPSNILRASPAHWYILDWDDLALGDPAQDWILLLSPLGQANAEFPVGFGWHELVQQSDPGLEERMEFYSRAILMDRIVDGLADAVEAQSTGEDYSRYQAEKKESVLLALEQYRLG